MSNVRLLHSSGLRHAEYADAAVVPAGMEIVFLAGACPLDDAGNTVAPGDVTAQATQALNNMDIALNEAGATVADVAFVRVLVATRNHDDLGLAWAAVRRHFGAHQVPGTLHGVTVLGYPGQLVEIEPVAVIRPRQREDPHRTT